MTDDPDSALTYALWHAETSGLEVKTPMDNFADIYTLFAQQVREGLRAKGFDVVREVSEMDEALRVQEATVRTKEWPDPTPEMLQTPEFKAVWQCIKRWDINVPEAYSGYSGATGNHVRAILDALGGPIK